MDDSKTPQISSIEIFNSPTKFKPIKSRLEIERKFLISLPKSWSQIQGLILSISNIFNIEISFLISNKDNLIKTLVKSINVKSNTIVFTLKIINIENEFEIFERNLSQEEYQHLVKFEDLNKSKVKKTKMLSSNNIHNFEINLYQSNLKELVMLTTCLKHGELLFLPTYFNLIKEITDNQEYLEHNFTKDYIK